MERPFDHEKLDVYQIELQFIAWLSDFFLEVSQSRAAHCRELFDQLDRASLSALPNTAEGNGKRRDANEPNFSMMREAQQSNALLAWMRQSRNDSSHRAEFNTARKCSVGRRRCSRALWIVSTQEDRIGRTTLALALALALELELELELDFSATGARGSSWRT